MWLLLLFLVQGCFGPGSGSECVDHTLRCTHRRAPFPARRGLPETREALDAACRNQNEYYDCLQNAPRGAAEGSAGGGMSGDKLDRLEAEYMLGELCTEGAKARNNYLKYAACINKQKTDVCLSPEFLVILLANENALSKCSVHNKVTSCVSMMLAMNCGAEAGFLYRRLLNIANDGDVLCNSGEDLGEVFSVFKLEGNGDGGGFDPRFGKESLEDVPTDKHLYHRVGEAVGNDLSEHNPSESTATSTASYSENLPERRFEADNFTFLADDWNEMEPREDWVLKTLYGRSQLFQAKSDGHMRQDLKQEICLPFEVNSKKQTNVNEQCFDQLLEGVVEKHDPTEYGDRGDAYTSFGYRQDDTTKYSTESIAKGFIDPVLSSNEFIAFSSDETTLDVDPVLESKRVEFSDDNRGDQNDLYQTELITEALADLPVLNSNQLENSGSHETALNPELKSNIQFFDYDTRKSELVNENSIYLEEETISEHNTLKEYAPTFYEKNDDIDLENKDSYNPQNEIYIEDQSTDRTDQDSPGLGVEYQTFDAIDKAESMDSIRRNLYTITDSFPYGDNLEASFPTAFGGNTYFVEVSSVDVDERDSKFEETAEQNSKKEQDALIEIVKRIGEIEVALPLIDSLEVEQPGTSTTEEVFELSKYSMVLNSNAGGIEDVFLNKVGDSIWYEYDATLSNKDSEVGSVDQKLQVCDIQTEKYSDKLPITLNHSEECRGQLLQGNENDSLRLQLINIEDLCSSFTEDEPIKDSADLLDTNSKEADYSSTNQELVDYFITPVNNEQADIVSRGVISMDTNEIENTGFTESDSQDLNYVELASNSQTNLEDLEDQHIIVHEYMPLGEKGKIQEGEVVDELKFTNVNQVLSSSEIGTVEDSDELPAVNLYTAKNYGFVDEPLRNVKFIDSDGSGYIGDTYLPSDFDELKMAMGASDDAEIFQIEKTKANIAETIEGTGDLKSNLSQKEITYFDKPTIVEILDENVRKYSEQRPNDSQSLLILLTDVDGAELYSRVDDVKDLDPSRYSLSDISGTEVVGTEFEEEPVVVAAEDMLSGDTRIELFQEFDPTSMSTTSNTFDESSAGYEPVRESLLSSLKSKSTELAYLSESDLDSIEEMDSDPPEEYETFKTIGEHSIFQSANEARDILDTLDLAAGNPYLISEDIAPSEEESSLILDDRNTDEAENPDFAKGTRDPEEMIMSHLDNLLLEDKVDPSSGDIVDIKDVMNGQESGKSANLDSMEEIDSDPPEEYETSETIGEHSIFQSANKARNILETLDLATGDRYSISQEERSLYVDDKSTNEAEDPDFAQGAGDPEEIIMSHLDNLLLEDKTDHSSGDIAGIKDQESGKSESKIEELSVGQMSDEKPKCDMYECMQLASKNLAIENIEQEFNSYSIATNRIKIPTFPLSDFPTDRLISNKVHSSCDSILALMRENEPQGSVSDMKRRIPSLHFFNVPGDSANYACYIQNHRPSFVAA